MPSWRRWDEDERNETREAMARAIAAYERAMWRPAKEGPIGVLGICLDPLGGWGVGFNTPAGWSGIDTSRSEPLHFRPLPLPPEDEA
jgi:hypothetical protein